MKTLLGNKYEKIFGKAESVFKYLYLITTLLSFNNLLYGSVILKVFVYSTFVLGGVLVVNRLLHFKKYFKFYGLIVMILFSLSYFLSAVINRKYGIIENGQALVWMTFQIGLLYVVDKDDIKKTKKDFYGTTILLLVYVALSNIVSVAMLFTGYGKGKNESFNGTLLGYMWGRLWGVYSDPNYGSVLGVAAILISVYFMIKTNKKWLKALLVMNCILSVMYITFSNSRTGLVSLIIAGGCFTYFTALDRIKINRMAKQIISVVLAVCIGGLCWGCVLTTEYTYNGISKAVYEYKISQGGSQIPGNNDEIGEKPVDVGPNIINREGNELEEDVTNGRFSLWLSGIEVWKTIPIFGTSHRNFLAYAQDRLPHTYLVENDKGANFKTTHNVLIDLLACEGILGFAIFMLFAGMIIVMICKNILFAKKKKTSDENSLLISLAVAFACSGMFVLEILFINSAGAFMFWSALGLLVTNLKYDGEK